MTIASAAPIVNPTRPTTAHWPAWTDESRWAPTPDADDYRPSVGPDFAPTPSEDTYWASYALRMAGIDADPPADLGPIGRADWTLGRVAAFLAILREEREYDAHIDAMAADRMEAAFAPDPSDRMHESELCRAR
jgi:hypothetical protein